MDLFIWPTHRSYTREPVAELHTIGSRPVLEAVVDRVCESGARLAEPGEFTLRAFLVGRLDLTQAEAVLGIVDAADPGDYQAALSQLAGGLARPLIQLRDDLIQLLAELEAGLDFVDEDIRFISQPDLLGRIQAAIASLAQVSDQMNSRHTASAHFEVVLFGPPNVGKSSLFNAMVRQYGTGQHRLFKEAVPAIVSPVRGTTRDYLKATVTMDGLQFDLVDTAGIDAAPDLPATSIEAKAQSLTTERRERAYLRAYCLDATDLQSATFTSTCDIVVITKSDLLDVSPASLTIAQTMPVVITSSQTGEGLAEFFMAIGRLGQTINECRAQIVVPATADRCRESIRLAMSALSEAADVTALNAGDELAAVHLRAALDELGKVVGAVYTDDLLDRIFKTFCIGK